MKRTILSLLLFIQMAILFGQNDFSFAYLPDLHLSPESAVLENFERLTVKLNELDPDFILTGGDMIYTAKSVNDKKATALFDVMDKEFELLNMPVYLTMGNHENVGITEESGIDKSNPMWGKRMYEKRYTSRYYSFTKEDWKFFILDGIKILEKEKNYTQGIDKDQIDWIKEELKKTDKETPIIISIHTPLINPHAMRDSDSKALSSNAEAVLSLFEDHDLRIVLQGHNHIYMNLYIHGIHYISGGSTMYGTSQTENGFILVNVKNGTEEIQFIPSFNTDHL